MASGVRLGPLRALLAQTETERTPKARRTVEALEQARAEAEARHVALVAKAAVENWQAAAWLLERRYPERWARISQRGVDVPVPGDTSDPFAEVDELARKREQH